MEKGDIFRNVFDFKIKCPLCGFDYVHFENPVQVSSWEGRGDALKIPMWCEGGHKWELFIGFHKGFTLLSQKTGENYFPVIYDNEL